MKIHRSVLVMLYVSGFTLALAVAAKGVSYYTLPLTERPHDSLHRILEPGGLWGHGLGILGSAMMLLLFLYSARKRFLLGLRFGKIGQWLNIHIFFGIMGPIFVTLHTAFKFGGFVSVSYYSMIAVMLSGFVGRYLYVQIPRTLSGDELSMKEMEEKNKDLAKALIGEYGVKPQFLQEVQAIAGVPSNIDKRGFAVLSTILKNDLTRPIKMRKLKKKVIRENGQIPTEKIDILIDLIKQKVLLTRKMAFLSSIQPLFHYWHVI
ncbi:MAG: hypothetical protein ACE5G1_16365, partial [bacterium]